MFGEASPEFFTSTATAKYLAGSRSMRPRSVFNVALTSVQRAETFDTHMGNIPFSSCRVVQNGMFDQKKNILNHFLQPFNSAICAVAFEATCLSPKILVVA